MKREQALSEVIGFLMIVSLLAILFSMYLLYVVPIQGRDAEISHMKYITQEFIGLKADIDGLIINDKINMPISRSFELGTLSSVGKGSFSVMPMSSFIEAAGTLMVNEQNDYLTVTVVGDFVDYSGIEAEIDAIKDINPQAITENIRDTDRFRTFLLEKGIQKILFWDLGTAEQTVVDDDENGNVDVSPYEAGKLDVDDDGAQAGDPDAVFGKAYYFGDRLYVLKTKVRPVLTELIEDESYEINPSLNLHYRDIIWSYPIDLVIEGFEVVDKVNFDTFLAVKEDPDSGDVDYLSNVFAIASEPVELDPYIDFDNPVYEKTLIKDLKNGQYYTINIFEDNNIIPKSLEDYVKIHPEWLENIRDTLIRMEYAKHDSDVTTLVENPIKITTHRKGEDPDQIGSLQYWSQNRYWVNQELLYEMGGLFLKQSDGVSIMLVPSISATEVTDIDGTSNFKLTLTNIRITDTEDVSGSLSAQVFSKVDSISHSLIYGSQLKAGESPGDATTDPNYWKLQEGTPNAQFLWIKYVPEMDLEPDRKEASVRLWKRGFDQIKTIASKSMTGGAATMDAKDWITVVTVIDKREATPIEDRYSANLIIAYQFNPSSCVPTLGVDGCSLDQLETDANTFTAVPHTPFILDYKEAELSLVMQSGAL